MMGEWQPIETAPRDGHTSVLLWFYIGTPGLPGMTFIGIWGYPPDNDKFPGPCWVDPDDGERLGDPTHWMHLPSPPVTREPG